MKIIIFGGSFDPIHLGHIEIAKKAYNQINADILYFVPAKNLSYKSFKVSANHRLEMIKINIKKEEMNFKIDDFELLNNEFEYSYTINLIKYFKHKFKNDELFFLIGNDQLEKFHKWQSYQDILNSCKLLVYRRDKKIDYKLIEKYNAIEIKGMNINAASSKLADLIINKNIDKDVLSYIIKYGLYNDVILKMYMDEKRYLHSMRVAKYMKNIFLKINPNMAFDAWIAGLYHDIAKCLSKEHLEYIAYDIMNIKKLPFKTLHGVVGAYLLKNIFNYKNGYVLNAIARHTLPFEFSDNNLTTLDKALYCCDKLEAARTEQDITNIDYYRKLLEINIDKCFFELHRSITNQYNNSNNNKIIISQNLFLNMININNKKIQYNVFYNNYSVGEIIIHNLNDCSEINIMIGNEHAISSDILENILTLHNKLDIKNEIMLIITNFKVNKISLYPRILIKINSDEKSSLYATNKSILKKGYLDWYQITNTLNLLSSHKNLNISNYTYVNSYKYLKKG